MATVPVALRQDVVRKVIMVGSPWWNKDLPLTADIKQKIQRRGGQDLNSPCKDMPT